MKRKLLLMALAAMPPGLLCAQTLERQVVGAAGIYQGAGWGSISSTTGEAVISTLGPGSGSVVFTQGFQQPLAGDFNDLVQYIPGPGIKAQIFPNPASEVINIVIDGTGSGTQYSVILVDILGQQVASATGAATVGGKQSFVMDVHQLADAPYFIRIYGQSGQCLGSFKFSKN